MTFYIAIIDYERGNIKSISKLLQYINVKSIITSKYKEIINSNGVILPGVGAFGDAMTHLNEINLIPTINEIVSENIPLFGICLGHQLLFSKSEEMGIYKGLDLIKGRVISFDLNKVDKIPQIGWNSVNFQNKDHFLIQDIPNNSFFYFVHSFYTIPEDKENIIGSTQYGNIEFCSIVSKKNIFGTQFHPEKSSKYGIIMYQNFIEYCKK